MKKIKVEPHACIDMDLNYSTVQMYNSELNEVVIKKLAMEVKFKKVRDNAKVPTKATEGSAGYDLYSSLIDVNRIGTGIALEIPKGYVGLIKNRSSLGNYVFEGIIDSDYRGELMLLINPTAEFFHKGKIAQLLIQKVEDVNFVEVEELSETNRGTGGFGSTDE